MAKKRRQPTRSRQAEPILEEGRHGICADAIASAFRLEGRVAIWVCRHPTETKVSLGFPKDATSQEAEAAYFTASEERLLVELAATGRGR